MLPRFFIWKLDYKDMITSTFVIVAENNSLGCFVLYVCNRGHWVSEWVKPIFKFWQFGGQNFWQCLSLWCISYLRHFCQWVSKELIRDLLIYQSSISIDLLSDWQLVWMIRAKLEELIILYVSTDSILILHLPHVLS